MVADSFRGLPVAREGRSDDVEDALWEVDFLRVPQERVQANFARYDLLDDQVRFLPGWFEDTLPTAPVEQIAVMGLDGDMYDSTMVALRSLYLKLSVGGYVIVDDYLAVRGCKHAVDDFRAEHGITDELCWSTGPATSGVGPRKRTVTDAYPDRQSSRFIGSHCAPSALPPDSRHGTPTSRTARLTREEKANHKPAGVQSCQGGAMAKNTQNEAVIERLIDCINSKNIEVMDELFHNDAVMDWPQSGERVLGAENRRGIYNAFPRLPTITPRRMISDGDLVVAEAHLDYGGPSYETVFIFEFKDGKIAQETAYWSEAFEAPAWRSIWVEKSS